MHTPSASYAPSGLSASIGLILGPRHLDRVLRTFVEHYNRERPHRALGRCPPGPYQPALSPRPRQEVKRRDQLGGLLHGVLPHSGVMGQDFGTLQAGDAERPDPRRGRFALTLGDMWRGGVSPRLPVLLAVGLLAVTAGLAAQAGGLLSWLERPTVDTRFSLRGSQRPPRDVVVSGSTTRACARCRVPHPTALPRACDRTPACGRGAADRLRHRLRPGDRRSSTTKRCSKPPARTPRSCSRRR